MLSNIAKALGTIGAALTAAGALTAIWTADTVTTGGALALTGMLTMFAGFVVVVVQL